MSLEVPTQIYKDIQFTFGDILCSDYGAHLLATGKMTSDKHKYVYNSVDKRKLQETYSIMARKHKMVSSQSPVPVRIFLGDDTDVVANCSS